MTSPDTGSNPSAPQHKPVTGAVEFTPEMQAEIDAAMAAMDANSGSPRKDARAGHRHDTHKHDAPMPNAAPAPIRGPRVVQAGREHRSGKVVSVGPTDIFLEFGPKELGVLPRAQFPEDKDLPTVGTDFEVVIDKFESSENIYICSRPGMVTKAAWEMLEAGQVVEGRVTGVVTGKDNKQAGLELEVAGHKAFMPASQCSLDRVPDLSIFVGEKFPCTVARVDRMGKGNIVLSRRDLLDAERKEQAAKLRASLQEGQTLDGTVRKIMPFGAFVDIGGVDGLVHVSDLTYDRTGFGEKAVSRYVKEGQKVSVRVLKVDLENNRISLGLKQVAGDPFQATASQISEGAEVTGKVVRITEFGAFVDLGSGVDGLVHISEIDHKRIARVEDALKVDEVVRAKVLKIDPASRRISLSVKALKPLPEIAIGSESSSGSGGRGKGRDGKGGKDRFGGRSEEEIRKETPALRRAREKFKQFQFKGGLG